MEKILRQTILRRNHLLKKSRKADLKDLRGEWREHNQYKQRQQGIIQKHIIEERKARREDWLCGPLAPNRDAGELKGKYGSVSNMLQLGAKPPKRLTNPPRGSGADAEGSEDRKIFADGEWSGVGLLGNVVVGDRVAVVRGRPGVKGLIGEVSRVEVDQQQVFVKDVNKVDITIPVHATGIKDKYSPTEVAIDMSDVRLLIRLEDPEKGTNRDYIVKEVRGGAPYYQREPGSILPRHTRYVVGKDFEIPWPADQEVREYRRDDDTTEFDMNDNTYVPSILVSPIENGVIDELRGKYSRTRKTHDDMTWVQKKVVEDMRASWLKQRKSDMTVGSTSQRRQKEPNPEVFEFIRQAQKTTV